MESPLGLLSLPEEVLHHLAKYLSLSDVVSCSKTCHYLRSALNHNMVWKRYLPAQDISRLETQNQYVEPTFQQSFQPPISPLCSSRLLLMKKIHLLNNWRNGNYEFKPGLSRARGAFDSTKGHGKLYYEHRYIFTGRFINNSIDSKAIEVWDVENEPVLHCSLLIKDVYYDSFCIIGDYLVVIVCKKVDVYGINLTEKAFPIKYSFIITEDSVSFNTNAPHSGSDNSDCVGWSHHSVDQYLISNKCGEDLCVLHVWDIINATKTGTFLSPVQGFSIRFHLKMGSAWILKQCFQSNNIVNYFSFDINKLEFSDDYLKLTTPTYMKHIIFHMNYVLVFRAAEDVDEGNWHDTICSLYDFNSSIKLKERRFNNARNTFEEDSCIIVDGSFIMLCAGCFQIVDAISLEILETIECSPMFMFMTCQYNIFGNLFALVSSSDLYLELWDIKKKTKVPNYFGLFCTSQYYLDDLASKVVCIDNFTIAVTHYW